MARILLCSLVLFSTASFVLSQTFLQKHVAFFDRNNDGIIYPKETFEGMRALGASVALSTTASLLINGALSSKTRPGEPPSLELPIVIKNIALAKHGSDSGTYDHQGGFVEEKFNEIFSKHGFEHPGSALTEAELFKMLNSFKEPNDTTGPAAALSEWKIAYDLFKDKDGLLQKETLRGLYDGSLFYNTEKGRKNATRV